MTLVRLADHGQNLWSQELWNGSVASADGSTGSAEPVEELAVRVRATGAGARSLVARWLSPSDAAFAGEQR